MPDLGMSVSISRDSLSLTPLDINDHLSYYVTADSFGRQVQWSRQKAESPFIDGDVTTYRTRQKVNSQIGVEVLGGSQAEVQANVNTLIQAFSQSQYDLSIAIGGANWQYDCEAADYQEVWTGPRWVARQLQVIFTVPNQPVPLIGAY